MPGRKHTREYQTLLRWTMLWINCFKMAIETYDQSFGDKVCLSDEQGIKIIPRVTTRVMEKEDKQRGIEHP